jgi:hypothetical protein
MDGRGKGRGWAGRVSLTVAALALMPAVGVAADAMSNVRLVNIVQKSAVARVLGSAARQLGHPQCQGLLDEFKDASGQPLRATLEAYGLEAAEYLERGVFFYDAPSRLCGTANLAVTTPGSRAVFVCGERFVRQTSKNSRHVEAVLIHEALHSLGLGENPPSSDYINDRVLARCGQR